MGYEKLIWFPLNLVLVLSLNWLGLDFLFKLDIYNVKTWQDIKYFFFPKCLMYFCEEQPEMIIKDPCSVNESSVEWPYHEWMKTGLNDWFMNHFSSSTRFNFSLFHTKILHICDAI